MLKYKPNPTNIYKFYFLTRLMSQGLETEKQEEYVEKISPYEINIQGSNAPQTLESVALLPSNMFWYRNSSEPLKAKQLKARSGENTTHIGPLENIPEINQIHLPEGATNGIVYKDGSVKFDYSDHFYHAYPHPNF